MQSGFQSDQVSSTPDIQSQYKNQPNKCILHIEALLSENEVSVDFWWQPGYNTEVHEGKIFKCLLSLHFLPCEHHYQNTDTANQPALNYYTSNFLEKTTLFFFNCMQLIPFNLKQPSDPICCNHFWVGLPSIELLSRPESKSCLTKRAATVIQLNEIAHLDVLFFGYIPLITVTLDTFLVFQLSTIVKGRTTAISDETKADEKFTMSCSPDKFSIFVTESSD